MKSETRRAVRPNVLWLVSLVGAFVACDDTVSTARKAECNAPCPENQLCVLQAGAEVCVPSVDPPEGDEVSRPSPAEDTGPNDPDGAQADAGRDEDADAKVDVDGRVDPPGADARVDPPGADARVDPPGADARVDPPGADARVDPPGADARVDPPGADARVDPPGADARVDPPGADARVDPPGADARVDPPGADARVDPPGVDAAVPPPDRDAAEPPPDRDAAEPPPEVDAAVPPSVPPCARCGPLGPQNDFGPAARLTGLDIPSRPGAARAAGCNLVGDANGTGPGFILGFLGADFGYLVDADPLTGDTELLLLSQAVGWDEGETLGDTGGPIEVPLMFGRPNGRGGYLIDRAQLGPGNAPVVRFVGDADNQGAYLGRTPVFELTIPLAIPFTLTLTGADLAGTMNVGVAGVGFDLAPSRIQGYWREADLQVWLADLQASCDGVDSELCTLITDIAGPPGTCVAPPGACPAVLDVADLFGGLDARVVGGQGVECDPDLPGDCDAIGVCLVTTLTGTTVTGYTAP